MTAAAIMIWTWLSGIVAQGWDVSAIGAAIVGLPIALFLGVAVLLIAATFSAPWVLTLGALLVGALSRFLMLSGVGIILVSVGFAALAGAIIEALAPSHFWVSGAAWAAPVFGLAQGWFHSRKIHG
jgi:hypothetical protein